MSPRDRVRLQHMIDAIEAAERFAHGRRRSDLDSDEMLLFALLRALSIVGEAAANVSAEERAKVPDVPWAAITGMRNRVVHEYFQVDRDILWTTVTEAMPKILAPIRQRLAGT